MSNKIIAFLLIIGALIIFLPYWFMLIVSFETIEEAFAVPPHFFPFKSYN
ncbi:hypothetical protein [Dictyoglomus thermophilum]|uniref:Carbohydrate ABC transporter permease n=1 Tax=Dictyoglomus thermophilum (strain ATCC 35947 / DSM 3960 / H-6-12) TaxID=309799 RepID=B5YBD4_DICT6|nr:hypothetical protein [Dictyoglomus thermophilum]ACI19910.1 hypothetical protein DICTH_0115 [Dictyoglomus thermophilum H-6-12]